MGNTQQIRRRIKSITNTRQITKAMELVAAAKMRKAQELTLKSRNYSNSGEEILRLLKKASKNKKRHPLLVKRNNPKKILLIVISSDKGLAGSYNSFVLRKASKFISEQTLPTDVLTIGKKAQDFFSKTKIQIVATFTGLPPYPQSTDIKPIIEIAINDFLKKKTDKIVIAYTKFHSTIKQEAVLEDFLPISDIDGEGDKESIIESSKETEEYQFEPTEPEVLSAIVPRLVEIALYQKLLESIASEHSARMVAMKSASDNAKDIISDLQLTYNSIRQASITQELSEITAGANALN